MFLKIKSETLVFAYNRCLGYLFILSFLFAYLFIISTTNNARKSIMSIVYFCWFKDKSMGSLAWILKTIETIGTNL